jgi:ATP-dependent DNA helicase RecQ
MNTTTIEGHLSFYIQLGELDITELVTSEKIKMIKAALEKHGLSSIKSIKENLPENIGYGEIKMVMAAENQQVEN